MFEAYIIITVLNFGTFALIFWLKINWFRKQFNLMRDYAKLLESHIERIEARLKKLEQKDEQDSVA